MGKANVLVTLDNSNSMDEAPNGSAVGSNNAASKSEIARGVIRSLTDTYRSRVNMGLMTYRQEFAVVERAARFALRRQLRPCALRPGLDRRAIECDEEALPRSQRQLAGQFRPFQRGAAVLQRQQPGQRVLLFAHGQRHGRLQERREPDQRALGPISLFHRENRDLQCAAHLAQRDVRSSLGFRQLLSRGELSPTDSDFAQGILDFGRFLTWNYVGPTWFRNDSPGRGFLHMPLGDLGNVQAATSSPSSPATCRAPGCPARPAASRTPG